MLVFFPSITFTFWVSPLHARWHLCPSGYVQLRFL